MDTETLVDACWAISYLSDGPQEAIQAVIDVRIPKRLVELLSHESTLVQTPALRAVGNIVTGNDLQTQVVINAGVLPALRLLLSSPKENIKKEACWTISNITAGNTEQIQAVIDANLIPPLVKLLEVAEYKTKKEACWAISKGSSLAIALDTKGPEIRTGTTTNEVDYPIPPNHEMTFTIDDKYAKSSDDKIMYIDYKNITV